MKIIKLLIFIITLFLLAMPAALFAQSGEEVFIKNVDTGKYPNVKLYVNFEEGSRLGALDLEEENFAVAENGEPIEDIAISRVAQIEEPIGVVLAIDTSGSMRDQPMEDARQAALVFMDAMRPIDEFSIIGFAGEVDIYSDFTSRRAVLKKLVLGMEAGGETALFDAIIVALNQFEKRKDLEHRYLIVLSDGEDTVSKLGADDVLAKADQAGIPIYSVVLQSYDFNPVDLSEISSTTGAEIMVTTKSEELAGLYREISRKIRNQYQVTYTSSWPNTEEIGIALHIGGEGLEGTGSANCINPFYAPPPTTIVMERMPPFWGWFKLWWVRLILYGAIFIGIILFIYILAALVMPSSKLVKKRTEFYGYKPKSRSEEEEIKERKGKIGFIDRLVMFTSRLASKRGFVEYFDLRLERAGMSIRASEFITLHIFLVIISIFGIYIFTANILLTLLMVLVIIFAPFLIINYKTEKRLQKFNEQLPGTLQLISGSLKAGYSFNQALSMVVEETEAPMSYEFKKVLSEIRMGLSQREALENMSKKMHTEHFRWVVMAVNIQREVGGNLVEVLETIASTIRERDTVLRQIKALTAEGRLSAIILIALPILLAAFISFTNREYISLLLTIVLGLAMIGVSALLMIAGIIWIVKIIKVQY